MSFWWLGLGAFIALAWVLSLIGDAQAEMHKLRCTSREVQPKKKKEKGLLESCGNCANLWAMGLGQVTGGKH